MVESGPPDPNFCGLYIQQICKNWGQQSDFIQISNLRKRQQQQKEAVAAAALLDLGRAGPATSQSTRHEVSVLLACLHRLALVQ